MFLVKVLTTGISYTTHRAIHKFKSLEDHSGEEDITGKIVVITGANAGIGKVLTLQMVKRKAVVVMACRDTIKAEKVAAEVKQSFPDASLTVIKLDLGDLESICRFVSEIKTKFSWINILINNAGYMEPSSTVVKTKNGFEINMGINHLGHFLLTQLLLDKIKNGKPSRIICVGSLVHAMANLNIDDLNMEKNFNSGFLNLVPYNNSKLCCMLYARELGRRLEGSGVNTYAICPGLVRTALFSRMHWFIRFVHEEIIMKIIGVSPAQGTETIIYCALSSECVQDTGKLYRFGKYWKDADENLSNDLAKQLWEVSASLLCLKLKLGNHDALETENKFTQMTRVQTL